MLTLRKYNVRADSGSIAHIEMGKEVGECGFDRLAECRKLDETNLDEGKVARRQVIAFPFLRLILQHFRATLFHNSCIYFDRCGEVEYAA